MIAGHVAGIAVAHLAGRVAEAIPDALAAPVFLGRALDLIGGRGRAPHKAGRPRARYILCHLRYSLHNAALKKGQIICYLSPPVTTTPCINWRWARKNMIAGSSRVSAAVAIARPG